MISSFIEGLIESTLILSVFYLVYLVFFNKESSFLQNRLFLLLGVISSIVVPFVNISVPQNLQITGFINLKTIDVLAADSQEVVTSGSGFSVSNILYVLYITGASLFLTKFLLQLIKIFRFYSNSRIQHDKNTRLVYTSKKHPVFSFLGAIFIDNESEKSQDLDIIIKHERVHTTQKHSIDLLLFELLAIVQWFNPVVWFYRKSIKHNHEFLADKGVIDIGFSIDKYQDVLLQNYSFLKLGLTNSFNHSLTFKRLIMMKKNNRSKKSIIKFIALMPLLVFAVYFISCSENEALVDKQEIKEQTEKISKPPKIDKQSDVIKTFNSSDEDIFEIVEEMPEYLGGSEGLRNFIAGNVKYPEEAKKERIQGKVFVRFVVNKEGAVEKVSIVRGVDPTLDEEALRVVRAIPPIWTPGKQKGQNVSVWFTVPINFKLK